MNSKVPRLCNGCTPGLTILAFMGMTGGAYLYLYKQKVIYGYPRIPDFNPDSITKKELSGPGEADTKWQEVWGIDGKNYYICPGDMMAGAEYRARVRAAQNRRT